MILFIVSFNDTYYGKGGAHYGHQEHSEEC